MDDYLQKERQLLKQLKKCPIEEVTGLVGFNGGVGATQTGGRKPWTIVFGFCAWRRGSGSLCREHITIRQKTTSRKLDKEKERLAEIIEPETVVRVRARVAEENVFGWPQGLFEGCVGRDSSDSELFDVLTELQQIITFEDSEFGTFEYDRRTGSFDANAPWLHTPIRLSISADEPDDRVTVDSALEVARALWRDQEHWTDRVRNYAVEMLLPVKNKGYGTPLTADQFLARITLDSIRVCADGAFEFWHSDGDLFFGHYIEIRGNLTDGPTCADTPG